MDVWRTWSCLRDPNAVNFSLDARPGWLRLQGRPAGLDAGRPSPELMARPPWEQTLPMDDAFGPVSFLGIRQRHFEVDVSVTLDFSLSETGTEAGLAVFMSERCHYALGIRRQENHRIALLTKRVLDMECTMFSPPLPEGPLTLHVTARRELYSFAVADASGQRHDLGTGLTRLLGTELAGGFTVNIPQS